MRKKFIEKPNPLNDYLFLKVMGEKGDEEQLLSFLNAVLNRQQANRLVSVKILQNKVLSPQILGDKSSILDVLAELEDKTKVNTEVQIRNWENMQERSLYYWSREYTRNLDAGQDYKELPKVIEINIIDFDFMATGNYHTVFRLREDIEHDLILTDALEIHFINMVKFRRLKETDTRNNPLHRWLTYLDKNSTAVQLQEVMKMDNAIRKAQERQRIVLNDKAARREYEMRLMALSDRTSAENSARREGLAEGLAEGLVKGEAKGLAEGLSKGLAEGLAEGTTKANIENARKMKADNMPASQISKYTGLSQEIIAGL